MTFMRSPSAPLRDDGCRCCRGPITPSVLLQDLGAEGDSAATCRPARQPRPCGDVPGWSAISNAGSHARRWVTFGSRRACFMDHDAAFGGRPSTSTFVDADAGTADHAEQLRVARAPGQSPSCRCGSRGAWKSPIVRQSSSGERTRLGLDVQNPAARAAGRGPSGPSGSERRNAVSAWPGSGPCPSARAARRRAPSPRRRPRWPSLDRGAEPREPRARAPRCRRRRRTRPT